MSTRSGVSRGSADTPASLRQRKLWSTLSTRPSRGSHSSRRRAIGPRHRTGATMRA